MAKRRTWPAYVVLALCGAPIFIMAAWKFITDTPVESLVIELDAEGNATITANRRWTSETRTGFRLPEEGARFCNAVKSHALAARRGADGLPLCPVRIVAPGNARADPLGALFIAAMRSFLWQLTFDLTSAQVEISFAAGRHYPVVPLPSCDVSLAGLSLPTEEGRWAFEVVRLRQGCSTVLRPEAPSRLGTGPDGPIRPMIRPSPGHDLLAQLKEPRVGFGDSGAWRELIDLAQERETSVLARPEDADLSGMGGACLLLAPDSRAEDLVRALAFLTSREGLKVYIVWPEREDADGWWLAP